MAAFQFRLAYRYEGTLEVEGFVGTALSSEVVARENAIRKVRNKCLAIGETFKEDRLILSGDGLSPEEQKQIQNDWKISARSSVI